MRDHYAQTMGAELGACHHHLVNECAFLHVKWAQYVTLFGTNPDRIAILNGAAPGAFWFATDRRHRHIAHRDLALAMDRAPTPLSSASRDDVRAAMSAIVRVLNAVESRYTKAEVGYEHTPLAGDAEALLRVVRDGVEVRDARHQQLLSGALPPQE